MKFLSALMVAFTCIFTFHLNLQAEETVKPQEYVIGIDDVMDISVLQPEKLLTTVTVSPDGSITFPYIGSVAAKGLTLTQIQEEIQTRLGNGYMKYPVVAVSLRESRSRRYFVYGEVMKPGTYNLDANTTVLRAISMAGGFNKFGSSSRVKVLRPLKNKPGYDVIKVNIKSLMDGSTQEDVVLQPEDIVVVSEGVF
jgi:polysaccharide biosynthesis/export protein